MKKGKLKYVLGLILATVMIGAAAIPLTEKVVDASSATTYTRTQNADGENVRCQDGYLPETTLDRIGLNSPKDMVIDKVIENGQEVEYGYVEEKEFFHIERQDDGVFNCTGEGLQRLFEMTDFNSDSGRYRFARQLRSYGLDDELRKLGVKNGDIVRIFDFEFEFID